MALETSAEAPVPVRTVMQAVGGWISKLGRIWVEGQIAECKKRGNTVFVTLRDPIAAVSALGPSDWPWWGGLGVKLHHHGVGVVGSTDGVVNVKFKTPQKVRAVVSVNCEQLWISIAERDAFLTALSEATKVPISDHLPF